MKNAKGGPRKAGKKEAKKRGRPKKQRHKRSNPPLPPRNQRLIWLYRNPSIQHLALYRDTPAVSPSFCTENVRLLLFLGVFLGCRHSNKSVPRYSVAPQFPYFWLFRVVYSQSVVAGGLELMSYATLLIPLTPLMILSGGRRSLVGQGKHKQQNDIRKSGGYIYI